MQKAGRILAIVFMVAIALVGLANGPREIPDAATVLQASVGWGQLLYGVLGILGAVGIARRRPWSATITAAWTLVSAYVASVASFAFHDPTMSAQGTLAGVLGAGFGVLIMGGLCVWAARVAARPEPSALVPPAA